MSALDGEIRNGKHHQQVRVYYEDTDFSGIVYHASYLRFMERGRTNYLRLIGADHRALFEQAAAEAPGFSFVVRHMASTSSKPAHMDDVLDIVTTPAEVKGASVTLNQKVMRGADLIVEADVQVAFVSGGRAGRSRSRCASPWRLARSESGWRFARAGLILQRMTARHFALFDTAIGACAIAWSARGIAGVQLAGRRAQTATRERVARRVRRRDE